MRAKFWLDLWHKNQIDLHAVGHNTALQTHWPSLKLPRNAPIFVPMCGKSPDMRWLASQGHEVVGVELAQIAAETYFAEQGPVPIPQVQDRFACYCDHNTKILQGDFFDLTSPVLGAVQAVYDRGALVALPQGMRFRYVDHLLRIIPDEAQILLVTFEYDQHLVAGPPHAVLPEEVESLFGPRCDIEYVESFVSSALPVHFSEQGVPQAAESVYLVTKRE